MPVLSEGPPRQLQPEAARVPGPQHEVRTVREEGRWRRSNRTEGHGRHQGCPQEQLGPAAQGDVHGIQIIENWKDKIQLSVWFFYEVVN